MRIRFVLRLLLIARCILIATLIPFLTMRATDQDDFTQERSGRLRLVSSSDD